MKKNKPYRPLPEGLTIRESKIEGLGLHTNIDLAKGTDLGISHVQRTFYLNGEELIRTPLGGFVNHSDTPNCKFIDKYITNRKMVTIRDIKAGEELTSDYRQSECGRGYIDNIENLK